MTNSGNVEVRAARAKQDAGVLRVMKRLARPGQAVTGSAIFAEDCHCLTLRQVFNALARLATQGEVEHASLVDGTRGWFLLGRAERREALT